MIAYREPLSFFLVLALSASSIVFANSENADGELSLLESVSWTEAIEDPSSTGAMISYYSKHPTSVPFFFPRLISIFEFMDIGDPKFCTLKQLSKNPQLSPRKQTQPFKETKFFQKKITESPKEILSLENRIRELEQKLLDVESRPIYQPNDDELRAFINRGHNVLSLEQRLDYLTKIISKENGFNNESSVSKIRKPLENKDLARSNLPSKPEVDMVSIPLPPPMEEFKPSRSIPSNVASNSKSVLRFKATVPTSQGSSRPAQASDFYLTTQNLQELLGELKIDRAVAGEVRSFAEIWARAEKDSISNPEIALGVKSILLEAKVGKTRTDPFGKAELNGVSPDDQYYLIGIDKDINSGVVTIWSKNIEVAPGENMVELTSNDVIYQD